MTSKYISKQNGRGYAIFRSREDQLRSIHSAIKKGNVVRFHDLIKINQELVKQFDLWLMVDAVTILYHLIEEGNANAIDVLRELVNRSEFTDLANKKTQLWREYCLDYYDLRAQLTAFKIALIKYSPNNPHLSAVDNFLWQWREYDTARYIKDSKDFCSIIQKASQVELNKILYRRPKDLSLTQAQQRLQAYRRLRYADKNNFWNLFKPRDHKLKVFKDKAASTLQQAIEHFQISGNKSFQYFDESLRAKDYKILYAALHQGRLHQNVVSNVGINITLSHDACLQFTKATRCSS